MNPAIIAQASAEARGCNCEPEVRLVTTGRGPLDGMLNIVVAHDDGCPAIDPRTCQC